MEISCKTIQGLTNLKQRRNSQDTYSIENYEGITSICVCDGAGFSDYGALAAKEVSKTVSKFMIDSYYCWDCKCIKRKISDSIECKLLKIAKKEGIEYANLASTIIGLCLKDNGEINMLHLGDGQVFAKRRFSDEIYYLSSAQNGIFKNQTYLTGSDQFPQNLRVYDSFKDPGYEYLYIMTDGGNELLFHPDKEQIQFQDIDALFDNNMFLKDDCTVIKIKL